MLAPVVTMSDIAAESTSTTGRNSGMFGDGLGRRLEGVRGDRVHAGEARVDLRVAQIAPVHADDVVLLRIEQDRTLDLGRRDVVEELDGRVAVLDCAC